MKRLPRYLLLAGVLFGVVLASGLGWLFFTPAGAQAVLRSVSRFSPLHIEAAGIQGRLAGTLRLTDARVRWPRGAAQIETLLLRWRPLPLLRGALVIERLQVSDGKVQLLALENELAAAPPDFTFPEIDGILLRLQAEIEQLAVERFALRHGEKDAVQVGHLYGGIAWEAGVLIFEGLDFAGSPGRFVGSGSADFVKPMLVLDVQLIPGTEAGALGTFDLQADLQPAEGRRQLTGSLALAVHGGGKERLRLKSMIDWRPDRIAVTELYLSRPAGEGEVRGEGAVLAAEGWPFDLSLHLSGVDLQAESGVHTALFGRLTAEGDRLGWQGKFSLVNRVTGWQKGELAGSFVGSPQGITFADLQGIWLQGTVQGEIAASWKGGRHVEAKLAGRNLQPAAIVPEWPGRINFTLQGTASWGEGAVPAVRIDGALHDSTLRGRALTGGIVAGMQGEDVRIDKLDLRGDGFALHAAGRLQERIDFRANISRLAGLVPSAEGSLRVDGWGRRQQGALLGTIAAQGKNLAWRDLRLRGGTLNARKKQDASFSFESDLSGVAWREYRLATAALQAAGTLAEHRLSLTTSGADLQIQLRARGGYREKQWQGELLALRTGGRLTGPWLLREPAELLLAPGRLQVAPMQLAGEGGEMLTMASDLAFSPLRGWIDAHWRQLDLARGNPWLNEVILSGRSNGSGRMEWLADERLDLHGEVTAAGSILRGGQRLQVRQGTARIDWSAAGLQAAAEAELADLGSFSLTAASSAPATGSWPREGAFAIRWRLPDLAPLSPWLPGVVLAGASSGTVNGRWWDGGGMEIAGKAEMRGQLNREALRLDIRRAQADFSWGAAGLQAAWSFDLGAQGRLAGEISSDEPARPQIPESGRLQAEWERIDLAVLRPWLPDDLLLAGNLSGETRGEWLPGQRWRLAGATRIVDGELQWQEETGVITADVQQGQLSWNWREEALAGDLRLQLAGFGGAEGDFRLPLPARWPLAIEPAGPLHGRLRANLQEEGLLNAFFPGLVQESRGRLALDLRIGGSWQAPDFGGDVHLREASAYLPTAGIRLQQVELAGKLTGQEFQINTLQLRSGDGNLAGEGRVTLKQWRVETYQLRLRGERFRTIHLPELRVQLSPDLQISGTPDKLTVRGEIRIPEMLITGRETTAPVEPSGDIVIVDAPQRPKSHLPLALDIRVRVLLGEHVLVDVEGIDARLEGSLLLTMTALDPDAITAQGEIRVAQGKYAAYGVSLDIERGNILFAGGPVARPTLDIRAVRKIGEVKAGVRVSGTPRAPRVELVSEPAMADTDILAYIVLGHPIGQEGGANAGLLMLAANNLLSKGESAVLQDRLKRTLGLDVLAIEAGDGDAQGSQITIGKYLNPDLYISFGQSLFNNRNEVRMRYDLSRRWQIESSVGEQSAVDLFYKIEFR